MNMPYKLLFLDCPWSYRDKAASGDRGASFKYQCMDMGELISMKSYIDEISDDDSVIFMWTTGPMFPDALKLMELWGFKFKTVAFTWIKTNKKPFNQLGSYDIYLAMGKDENETEITNGDFFGMGNTTRSNAEFILYGVKGKGIKRVNASVRSTIISPVREHSRKPDEARTRLETLYGDVPRIELFAREQFKGWDSMGDESTKFNKKE